MNDLIDRQAALDAPVKMVSEGIEWIPVYHLKDLPSAQHEPSTDIQDVLRYLDDVLHPLVSPDNWNVYSELHDMISRLPSTQPNLGKYEYHYDHTDCIWYRPEARNRCPVTCAQYRDGWNDAMNYIFRDGKGYMPYRRDRQYGE